MTCIPSLDVYIPRQHKMACIPPVDGKIKGNGNLGRVDGTVLKMPAKRRGTKFC